MRTVLIMATLLGSFSALADSVVPWEPEVHYRVTQKFEKAVKVFKKKPKVIKIIDDDSLVLSIRKVAKESQKDPAVQSFSRTVKEYKLVQETGLGLPQLQSPNAKFQLKEDP